MVGSAIIDKGDKIRRFEKKLDDPTVALNQIGKLMVAESRKAFREQSFGGAAWKERGPVNVFGIIADFTKSGQAPPARRFERRPALIDSGDLMRSIAFHVVGDVVEVGTNIPHAHVHQFGGETESKPITETVQKRLWDWLKRKGDKDLKKKLGFLLNKKFRGKTLKQKVPARPFVGVTKQTRDYVRRTVGVEIMEVE